MTTQDKIKDSWLASLAKSVLKNQTKSIRFNQMALDLEQESRDCAIACASALQTAKAECANENEWEGWLAYNRISEETVSKYMSLYVK